MSDMSGGDWPSEKLTDEMKDAPGPWPGPGTGKREPRKRERDNVITDWTGREKKGPGQRIR
jgi:hypothetical protein